MPRGLKGQACGVLRMNHAHSHSPTPGSTIRGRLRIAFALTSLVLILEAIGGWLTGSVALLADAGHMLTDAGALGIAFFAAWMSERPRTAQKSYGYGRVEILAALANGLLLGGVSVAVAFESISRLGERQDIAAGPMLAVAVIGLLANVTSAIFLAPSARENLNVRGAFFHVIGDALGSLSAIGAALCLLLWDLHAADALAGLFIAALLVASAARLILESVDILLEGTPRHLDLEEIAGRVLALPGVLAVHDLHIWTVTAGFPAMSAHIDLEAGADGEGVRRAAHQLLHQQYAIEHTTIQTEAAPGLLSIDPPSSEQSLDG